MNKYNSLSISLLAILTFASSIVSSATGIVSAWPPLPVRVEYILPSESILKSIEIPVFEVIVSSNTRITTYRNADYQVVLHEFDRSTYTEINGELEYLGKGNSCVTLRICVPVDGKKWEWFHGLDKSKEMKPGIACFDTIPVNTLMPPDGAFNGKTLSDGGYGDAVGRGTMSYYPLCAISADGKGEALGIDMAIPLVYRLGAEMNTALIAEFDVATSPLTEKFPNRAFFKLSSFTFDSKWGMRSALEHYYSIYPDAFKKRVVTEGIWLPFTSLRSIPHWEDFGFAFHETSWNNQDIKEGNKLANILSDKGTGVLSFQYTEPWDIQLPILRKNIPYDTLVSDKMIPDEHMQYVKSSSTEDKNGLLQARRLETCLLYTSPSPRDRTRSRMPSSA
jgi:hypothetical protein